MIAAAKNRWFNAWFARHARARIQRTFGRVMVAGLDETRAVTRGAPVLAIANHTTWWDALVALYASELLLGCDGYAMMDAANLRRLPFFRRVGAFGIDLEDPADGARGIRHAARLLDRGGRALWMFPEGRERSPYSRLLVQPGAAQIARVARRAVVVPVGLRYVFGACERPDLWIALGAPLDRQRDVARGAAVQQRGIERELERIDAAMEDRSDPLAFTAVHTRAPSRLGAFAERVLAGLFPS